MRFGPAMTFDLKTHFLTLLKLSLTDSLHQHTCTAVLQPDHSVRIVPADREAAAKRLTGADWPAHGETMVGLRRLENLQQCLETVIASGVPGDIIETGVWRGGSMIFARGILAAHGCTDRKVYLADSFQGLPPPNPELHPADTGDIHSTIPFLAVSEEEVRENFRRYHLLDDQVVMLKGWFRDTLPQLRSHQWAVIRLDGDMYESTMDGLVHLYDNLSPGGFAIIDDYGCLPPCKQAVDEFRASRGISEPLREVDWTGVYWRKP